MTWNSRKKIWSLTAEPAAGNPGSITVIGPEGDVSSTVSESGGGGSAGNGGGKGNKGGKTG